MPNGPHKGEKIDPDKWEGMLDEYYQLRGWNQNGVPTKEKLTALGLMTWPCHWKNQKCTKIEVKR